MFRIFLAVTIALGSLVHQVLAQNPTPTQTFGGVYVDSAAVLRYREADGAAQLARIRQLPRSPAERLAFVSLPRLFAQARPVIESNQPLPDEARYVGGIVQLRYVLLDPAAKDLLIAGPAEPVDASNPCQPLGKLTGRPVLQFDDLALALRVALTQGKMPAFGCSLDPSADALPRSEQAMRQNQNRPREALLSAIRDAIGPQQVTTFGPVADSRLAAVCLAADYKLKRLSLGLDPSPVPGLGSAIDNSRAAGNRFWFEASYQPLLISRDGTCYEIRGQRLQLKAGALQFDERGATPTAQAFAKQFTQKMPALCAAVPLFADLANAADLSLLANLIAADHLATKAAWDTSWLASGHRVASYPLPKTAETLICVRSGSVAAGGVNIALDRWVKDEPRQVDDKGALDKIKPRP